VSSPQRAEQVALARGSAFDLEDSFPLLGFEVRCWGEAVLQAVQRGGRSRGSGPGGLG
jgi:hypothetical protein